MKKLRFLHSLAMVMTLAIVTSAAHPARARDEIISDRIEINGVISLTSQEVEGALTIEVGEDVDRAKILRTVENLQSLYRSHGFDQMQAKTEITRKPNEAGEYETVVVFDIAEGLPTRIASIRFVALPGARPDTLERVVPLMAKLGVGAGDRLDREKLTDGQRAIKDALASQEYIGARMGDLQVVQAQAASAPSQPALKWVDVSIPIELGERVSFGFRGNLAFTQGHLSDLVDEQRLVGFGNDYVGSIQARIEDEYRANGYSQVKVESITQEHPELQERHVTYLIDEGPRVEIGSITFDGNVVYTSVTLLSQFYAQSPPLTQHHYYVAKEFDKSAELLIEWIKSQGYLSAKLVTVERTYNAKKNKINLVVYLIEGDRTFVESVVLKNLTAIDRETALETLGIDVGQPLNLFAFNEGLEALKARLHSMGYLDAAISNENSDAVIHYIQENHLAQIALDISQGTRYRISRIEVDGLSTTRDPVLRRELQFRVEDYVEDKKLSESETRLRRLGIFGVVSIRPVDDPNGSDHKVVRVSVQEGTPGVISGGVGFRSDLGVRTFGQTAYTNIWRSNHTVSFGVTANRRFDENFCSHQASSSSNGTISSGRSCFIEAQAQLAYVWPWFLFPELYFRPSITVERTKYLLFDKNAVEFAATWERQVFKKPNLFGGVTYGLERIKQYNASIFDVSSQIDNQSLTIGSVTPFLRLDLRDNPLAPTRGMFASTSFEIANPDFGSQSTPVPVGYTRWQARTDFFVPLAENTTFYFSFRTGIERNTEPAPSGASNKLAYQIPLSKQFTLGGVGSIRGFAEQALNAENESIGGTLTYVNYRTQIDLPFSGAMRVGPFLDAGYLNVDKYSLGEKLRSGAGAGLHYQSPVGPVNFDWAFNLSPKANESPNFFYFSIGVI